MRLLGSALKIGIFHAVLQMLRREQNCEICHIESWGTSYETSLINFSSTNPFSLLRYYLVNKIILFKKKKKKTKDI